MKNPIYYIWAFFAIRKIKKIIKNVEKALGKSHGFYFAFDGKFWITGTIAYLKLPKDVIEIVRKWLAKNCTMFEYNNDNSIAYIFEIEDISGISLDHVSFNIRVYYTSYYITIELYIKGYASFAKAYKS